MSGSAGGPPPPEAHVKKEKPRYVTAEPPIAFDAGKEAVDVDALEAPAAIAGQPEIAGLLLDHRANILTRDKLGNDALTYAADFGHYEVIEVLLEHAADLEAHQEILSLFGPSGAGKSTLLKVVAGLLDPDAGRLSLAR